MNRQLCTLPFHVVGISHERSSTEVIGRLGVAESEQVSVLGEFSVQGIACVLLSTCNRTELYWWGDADAEPHFRAWVAARAGADADVTIERFDADEAVRHLFAVAAGLRSQRLGEAEILGQVRSAWNVARDAGHTSSSLDTMFRHGIHAARYIRGRAGQNAWGKSLGEASVAFLETRAGADWSSRRVLVVGSGAAAESALLALRERSPQALFVTSRTDSRASALAARLDAEHVTWESRTAALHAADVVVFATRATTPVVAADAAHACAIARAGVPAWWLDLGVPANVEPHETSAGLSLHGLSELPNDCAGESHDLAAANAALEGELARFAGELHRRASGRHIAVVTPAAVSVAS